VPEGRGVELVAIDPGKRVAVQAATAPLSTCGDPGALATYLTTTEGAFFSMDKAEWEEASGRKEGVEREDAARRADPVYRRWCEADNNGHGEGEERVYRRWREADDRGRKKTREQGRLASSAAPAPLAEAHGAPLAHAVLAALAGVAHHRSGSVGVAVERRPGFTGLCAPEAAGAATGAEAEAGADWAAVGAFQCTGTVTVDEKRRVVTVTELPIGQWTEDFVHFARDRLGALCARPLWGRASH